ncbi:MAG: hypothetical protein GZ091_17450 [Paludibacter sp.]|nr:hypothetical protein [Paludibacter sp.]
MKTLKDYFSRDEQKENGVETTAQNKGEKLVSQSQTLYACPMKCEGDKTYDSPGNCPVCNMKLVPKSDSGTNGQKHEHNGRGHGHHGCC